MTQVTLYQEKIVDVAVQDVPFPQGAGLAAASAALKLGYKLKDEHGTPLADRSLLKHLTTMRDQALDLVDSLDESIDCLNGVDKRH